ncbi:MAG: aminopeptidase P N-terminal domain-containing protein, partial [Erysipelotrichaceae bacterium]|nr:aminopeptidase P N-terminal domain-containing protein [Erysipelotrichaceae bacterium]
MNQYSERRNKILNSMEGNCAFAFFSGKAPMRSQDEAYDFYVDRNFYYLTGLDKEDMVLVMYKLDGMVRQSLFILPYDELLAKWVGGRMMANEASEISGIQDVQDRGDLDGYIASLLNRTRRDGNFRIYFDLWHYTFDQQESEALLYANTLRNKYPYLNIKDSFAILTDMRLQKDEQEVAEIKKAIHTTNLGIRQMMRTCKPELNEMTMDGVFRFVLAQQLCDLLAFKTIAASGERAT